MGDVAQFMMVWWYDKMSQKLKEEGIEPLMYQRDIEDINTTLKV